MNDLPNLEKIVMPPLEIQQVGARRKSRPPRPETDLARPTGEHEQVARHVGDPVQATEAPNPPIDGGLATAVQIVQTNESANGDADYFTRNIELRPEIIGGLIREQQLGVLAGAFGVGKSPLLAHFMMCVLNGIPWCGREVKARPIIAFDFESACPTFKKNIVNLAERFEVPMPRVPNDLEVYLEQDLVTESATAKLLEILKYKDLDMKVARLFEMLTPKPNALVIIDPLEMLFRTDTRDKSQVLELYSKMRALLTSFPRAAILFTVNLRKKDRRALSAPSLFTDPRNWLEDVSGTLDILNRCDVRLGMDFHDQDGMRVVNGIRRAEEFHPILIQPVALGDEPDKFAGFDPVPAGQTQLLLSLSNKLSEYWQQLPVEFAFEEATRIMGKSNFDRLKKRTLSLRVLEKVDRGRFRKLLGPTPPPQS